MIRVRMKKRICLVLSLALLIAGLAACGQRDTGEQSLPKETGDGSQSAALQSDPPPDQPQDDSSQEQSETPSEEVQDHSSPSSEPAGEGAASASAAQSPSTAPKADNPEGSSKMPPIDTIRSFYARNPAGYTYVGHWLDFWRPDYVESWSADTPIGKLEQGIIDVMDMLEGLEPADEEVTLSDNEFLIWTTDGVRHTFGTGRGGYLVADGETYLLPSDNLRAVENLHGLMMERGEGAYSFVEHYPQWLVWMTPGKINEIIFHSPTRGQLSIASALFDHTVVMTTLPVQPTAHSTYALGSVDFSGSGVFHLEIRFDGGIVYHVYAVNDGYEGDYYVESSDMTFGCKYRLKLASISGAAQHLIEQFEHIADARTEADVLNPAT